MFKVKPYNQRGPDTRTDAQKKAHARNYRIFTLRGLASHRFLLTGPRRDALVALVDAELALIGGTPTAEHDAEKRAAMEAKWAREDAITETEIPF